jgi:hypothetical protein
MEDFNSDTDSDYTSYWRDWVGTLFPHFGAPVASSFATRAGAAI